MLTPPNTREVDKLTHVTDAEVRRLVLSAPSKSSDLDPLPVNLVKDCIDILVTPLVSIVNLSLSEGCFLSHFKSALISPLLKQPTFNRDDMKNDGRVTTLTLLDLCAGFDTIDHNIILRRLGNWFGVTGKALD